MAKKFKEDFIKEINEKGYPVIATFSCMDSSATIYAKSENEVFVDDYGSNYLEGKYQTRVTLNDLTEKGLYKLLREGVRKGEEDFDYLIKEEGDSLEAWHEKRSKASATQ
jgi:hypothetical protein